jgi:tripartite-type tricarboxylate transporter receptor subunit TctC
LGRTASSFSHQPGASGLIGAEAVARAEPDGYTIGGFNDSIMTMVPNLQSRMRWDIMKDFEPVSLVATVEWGWLPTIRPASGAQQT